MKYSSGSDDDDSVDESLANCFNCKSEYPPTKKKLKNIDWVQCDVCDEWFHELSVTRDKSGVCEGFNCNNCC